MNLSVVWVVALTLGLPALGAESFVQSSEDRLRIEQAVPGKPIVKPAKPRRLLIFTLNVGYGGHLSIAYANEAFTLMGKKTGAFETVVSADPAVFRNESLKQFDAVFFNNTVGNCFANQDLRQNLIEFITGGGGLLGVHGTTVAFTQWPGAIEDWPEFGFLLGARGANHKDSTEHVWIRLDDPEHPLNRIFGGLGFDYRDEFFRAQGTYSRRRVRVLLSIDTARTDVTQGQPRGDCYRADNDYALAWVRNYGRGRVFYSTIAHNPYVFWDSRMLQFYLAALQFALGDLAAPTTPSAALTPAVRAQEKLGWKLGLEVGSFSRLTLFDAVDKTRELRLTYIGASSDQQVSQDIHHNLDPQLTDAELTNIRLKLESAGLRLLTYHIRSLPTDASGCRKLFEFGRKMGIETFVAGPSADGLDTVARLCDEYGINLALSSGPPQASERFLPPRDLLKLCADRTKRIGVCADLGAWMRAGIDPIQAVRTLGDHLITAQMPELLDSGSRNHDAHTAIGIRRAEQVLKEIQRQHQRPTMFGFESSDDAVDAMPRFNRVIEFFNAASLKLTK